MRAKRVTKKEEEYSEIKGLPNEFFTKNRNRYISDLKMRDPELESDGVIVLEAQQPTPLYDSDENWYYFDPEGCFYYLTGVREPGLKCVIDLRDNICSLFFQRIPESQRAFDVYVTEADIQKKYNLPTYAFNTFESFLEKRDMKKIYTIYGVNEFSKKQCMTAHLDFQGKYEYLNKRVSYDKYIYDVLVDCRCRKTEDEINLLKYIQKITLDGYKFMIPKIKPGIYERDMEIYYMTYMRKTYYTRFTGYNAICGSGPNSAIMHYDLNNRKMEDGDLLLIDMGIRFLDYISDISVTLPVNGKFSEQQKKIYDIVLKAMRDGQMEAYREGVRYYDKDTPVFKIILKGLQEIGILKSGYTVDEMFNAGVHKTFTPHGLGHDIGIDVHDVGRGVCFKPERYLEAGNVITMEPGIYFIQFLIDKAKDDPKQNKYYNFDELEKYKDFGGVRLEDNVLVTTGDPINLSGDFPRTTEEIEELIAKHKNDGC